MADTKFKKGQTTWNKKKPIQKICKCGKEFSVKPSLDRVVSCSRSCAQLGKKHTNEQKRRIGLASKGNKHSLSHTPWNKGLKGFMAGEKHYNWKGGSGTFRHQEMGRTKYAEWRKAIFERDNYTCVECSEKGYIQADHIKSWAKYPELRYELDNGRTLCMNCHYAKTFNRPMPKGLKWGTKLKQSYVSTN